MSRIITATEIDRLHSQVKALTERVDKLEGLRIAGELFEPLSEPQTEENNPPFIPTPTVEGAAE